MQIEDRSCKLIVEFYIQKDNQFDDHFWHKTQVIVNLVSIFNLYLNMTN